MQAVPSAAAKAPAIATWRDKPDPWFKTDEGQRVVSNIIAWQQPNGGWHKAYDSSVLPKDSKTKADNGLAPASDSASVWEKVSTIDNDATYTELRILARAYRVAGREDAKASFERGMKFLMESQYENGGWPQRFPLQKNYGRHITYNDDAMAGVMRLVRDAAAGTGDFAFVPEADRKAYQASFDRGVECILNTQIVRDGRPTVWCQQHDEVTLKPANARSYELPSSCSSESAGLTLLLMEIEHPRDRVKAAIEGAVAWFEKNKIQGKEYARLRGPEYEKGYDRKLIDNPAASPVWPRFSELETDKPMFVDRDASVHWKVEELGYERRTGYAWYTTAPNQVLAMYPKWKQRTEGK